MDVQIDEGQVHPQERSDLGPHTELWRLLFRALASFDSDPTILRTIAITRWEGDGTHGVVLAKHAIGTIKQKANEGGDTVVHRVVSISRKSSARPCS